MYQNFTRAIWRYLPSEFRALLCLSSAQYIYIYIYNFECTLNVGSDIQYWKDFGIQRVLFGRFYPKPSRPKATYKSTVKTEPMNNRK